jgi:hypothetical protein
MNYLAYLFSDKKALIYWLIGFVGLSLYTVIAILSKIEQADSNFFDRFWIGGLLIIFLLIFIGYYTISFLDYRLQNRLIDKYSKDRDDISIDTKSVLIYQDSFNLTPLRNNYEAEIKIKPRLDRFKILEIGDDLILFGQLYEFGLFRRHLKPILITENLVKYKNKRDFCIPRVRESRFVDNDLELTFDKGIKSIRKITIKDK